MEKKYAWDEQLKKFEQVYFSKGINQQYIECLKKNGINPFQAKSFVPKEADELYTTDSNIQYHLNGRSILGVQRKWNLEKIDNNYQTQHGCGINPGLIQFDHSGFVQYGNMGEVFIKAENRDELLEIAKRLFDLSNENMAREFNIMSSEEDIATLFNAIILDPIVDYEIENENFGGYSRCWNDSNFISISTLDKEDAYTIKLQSSSYERGTSNPMIIELSNGESVIFKQTFNSEKKGDQYTIDDVSTEIVEVKGNSDLIKRVVAQIERFSERKLEEQEDNIEYEKSQELQETDDTHTTKDILTGQILFKKIQRVFGDLKNGNDEEQIISLNEFDMLNTMLYENVNMSCFGYTASDNNTNVPGWYTAIPVRQHIVIQLSDDKRICADFSAYENSGTIKVKDIREMTEPEDNGDFIVTEETISEQDLMEALSMYRTDETLEQLLRKKLCEQDKELSLLEFENKLYDEKLKQEEKDIGEN